MKKLYLSMDYVDKPISVEFDFVNILKTIFPELYFRYYVIDEKGKIIYKGESYAKKWT